MRRAWLISLFLLLGTSAWAADNAVIVTVGSGVTLRSKDIGAGVQSLIQIPGDVSGNALPFAGQNATSPGSAILIGCQFNTTPTTITSGNASPAQCANDGSFTVTVKSATGLAAGSTTSGQTGSLIMGAVTTNAPSYTTGQTNYASLTVAGATRSDLASIGGTAAVPDPCQTATKSSTTISQTGNTKLFSQASSKKNYICSIAIVGADAENWSLVEGTGTVCATSIAAIIGGTTAAAGPNFAANDGIVIGNGQAFIAAGANNNFDVCLLQSGSGRVAGVVTWVQQ